MLSSQRPHAAWAIWQSVLRQFPDDAAARAALDSLAASPELPEIARKPLRFLPPASETARQLWDGVLRSRQVQTALVASAEPSDAALAFRTILESEPNDPEATWNLAVCQAWMGTNLSALHTLERFVELSCETSPERAADAWTLAELLRHGAGAEDQADAVKLSLTVPPAVRNLGIVAEEIAAAFGPVARYSAPEGESSQISGHFAADILAGASVGVDDRFVRILASVVEVGEVTRFSAPAGPSSGLFFRELTDQCRFLQGGDNPPRLEVTVLPIALLDAAVFRFRLPTDTAPENRDRLTREAVADYFESEWIEQPRYGLNRRTPIQAAAEPSAALRAQLEGIVHFQEQLANRPGRQALYGNYDFDRLRYRLGLTSPPGKDDVKGEACHKALSLYDPSFIRTVRPESLKPEEVPIAWKTAADVHNDPKAIEFGTLLAERMPDVLAQISLETWVAPFLRRSLQGGSNAASDRAKLDFALKFDAEVNQGRETPKLLKWKAELASRLGDSAAASEAWKAACEHPGSPPINKYEAVVDLWELPEGPGQAVEFATRALTASQNVYTNALLRNAMEEAEGADS
jgi:hypothetical protein